MSDLALTLTQFWSDCHWQEQLSTCISRRSAPWRLSPTSGVKEQRSCFWRFSRHFRRPLSPVEDVVRKPRRAGLESAQLARAVKRRLPWQRKWCIHSFASSDICGRVSRGTPGEGSRDVDESGCERAG